MKNSKATTIPLKTKLAIGNRLPEVLTQRADGLWEYAAGHSDDTIAKEFDVAKINVSSVRSRVYGKLIMGIGGGGDRSSDIKKRLVALEKWASALDPAWNKIKL